ncbi:hypothetical protein [Heyndrickxia sporothermodurans]|nr:hypothetical protein [Heyndrickxia sporothermodurans]
MTKKRNFLLFSIVTILIVSILALSWIQYNQWKHSFSKRIHFSLPHASRTSGMAPLGNFISGQMRDYKDIGGMIDFKVSKKVTNNENKVKISDIHFTPTFVDNKNHHHYRVYPLKEAYKKGLIDHSYNEIMEHMTESMK